MICRIFKSHHILPALLTRQSQQVNCPLPPSQCCTSKCRWHRLLGTFRNLGISIPGGAGLFSHLQADLRCTGRVPLNPEVHIELAGCRRIVHSTQEHPTHILEAISPSPTWLGTSDVCNTGMGGVFWWPDGHPHVWRHRWPEELPKYIVYFQKHEGNYDINKIDIAAH